MLLDHSSKSGEFETPKPFCFPFFHRHVEGFFIKMHSIESRGDIGHCLQAHPCIFQPGNFTGWDSEGVVGSGRPVPPPPLRICGSCACLVLQVRVTNLLGGDLGQLTVTADSARHLGDEAIVLSKKQFTPASGDKWVKWIC